MTPPVYRLTNLHDPTRVQRASTTIRLVANLRGDDAAPVEWRWIDPEPTVLQAFELGDLQRQIEQQERQRLTAAAVVPQKLVDTAWPVREIAAMLDLSPGRVSQPTRPRGER